MRAGTIAFIGVLAMLWNLGTPSLWQDEAATIGASDRPLNSLFGLLTNVDAVHGLYYVFIHFWGGAFGFTPFSLRVPSAVAVGLSSYFLYFLALKLTNKQLVATWASVVFIALPRTHLSGSEARSNALTATMAIALVLVLLWALDKPKAILRWLGFSAIVTLSTYLFMFSALILLPLVIFVVIRHRDAILGFAVSSALALLAAGPVLVYGFHEKGQVGWITVKPIYQYAWESIIGVDYNRAWPMAVLGILLAGLAVARRASPLVTLWAVVPSAFLILVSELWKPYFVDHYLTFTTPATAILIALGINDLSWPTPNAKKTRLIQVLVGVVLVGLCLPSFISSREPSAKGTEWAQIARTINLNSQPGDSVLLPNAISKSSRALDLMIVAYAPEFMGRVDLTLERRPENTRRLFGTRINESLAIEPRYGKVLLVEDPTDAAATSPPAWLAQDFAPSKSVKFDSALITIFTRKN